MDAHTRVPLANEATDALRLGAGARSSVRRKLMTVVLVTTGTALLLAAAALLAYDVDAHRSAFVASLTTQAEILSLSAAPALAFDDRESARRTLESLRAGPAVAAAALYVDGERFADYARAGEPPAPRTLGTLAPGTHREGAITTLLLPVQQNDELLGHVYLRGRDDLAPRMRTYLSILALVLAASLAAAALLSRRLHRSITEPLEAMARVARDVVEQRDFSLRSTKRTDDEIGLVVDAFNAMLEEIELRTTALRESERLYRGIGESIDFGVWISDAQGRCLYVSDSFLTLIGRTHQECASDGWWGQLHPDDRDGVQRAWQDSLRTGAPFYCEHRVLGADGAYHPVLAQGVPIRDEAGRITRWAGINLDIERMKRTEEALRDADRRKDEFLATLAHELRNPLAPIRHAAKLLDAPGAEPRHVRWARDVIARQVARMALLLDDLLDVSRITRGLLVLKQDHVDLTAVVSAAVETAQPLIDAKHHVLTVRLPTAPVALYGDALRLSQAVSNLLTNAAKYTDPGGRITLQASVDAGGLEISVADSGIGLAPESLPRLFEMFSQVDSAAERAEGGLGIGLALVRGLVELHGGRVSVRSDGVGHGSTFAIHLPATRLRSGTASREPGVPHAVRRIGRVLVADDNRDAADTLAAVLRISGHSVDVAYGGREALELAERTRPEALILDVGMPDLDGHELAREIRARPWGATVLLLAVTGWGQESDKHRSRAAGFDHHLTKPVDSEEVERLLSTRPGATERSAPGSL